MNGSQILVEMLKGYGVRHVFGVPGDTSTPLYNALYDARDAIQHIMTRDERHASFMADAYARVTWRPGICDGPSGGGATYIVPGLAEANGSSIPVIALTTDNPVVEEGKGALTAIDQPLLTKAATKWNGMPKNVAMLPDAVRKAFRIATTGRPGAVHLALPENVLEEEMREPALHVEEECRVFPAYRVRPDSAAVLRAVETIASAERPVMLVGGGAIISGAWAEVAAVAELFGMPVATSINGKGIIPESHPLSLGVVGGNGGRQHVDEIVEEADLVLFVGTKANYVTTNRYTTPRPGTRIVQIDVDPTEIGNNYPVECAVVGDAKLALADVYAVARERVTARDYLGSPRLQAIARAAAEYWASVSDKVSSSAYPVKPQRIIRELQEALPKDAIVVADPGTMTPFVAAQFVVQSAGRRCIIPRAHAELGYAIPAALGAKVGRPDLPVVGICGDGSFGMACGELDTIVRLGKPLTIIQFTNGTYGWIKILQKLYFQERYLSVDFTAPTDAVKVAEGFGVTARRVEHADEVGEAIREALAADRPVFLEIPTPPEHEEVPPVRAWMKACGLWR